MSLNGPFGGLILSFPHSPGGFATWLLGVGDGSTAAAAAVPCGATAGLGVSIEGDKQREERNRLKREDW